MAGATKEGCMDRRKTGSLYRPMPEAVATKVKGKKYTYDKSKTKLITCLSRCKGIPLSFSAIFTNRNNFCDFLFDALDNKALSSIQSSHTGKNLLQDKQMLSLRADPQRREAK